MARHRLLQITIFLAMLSAFVQAGHQIMNSRKLDATPPDLENKCGNCPCDKPCNPPPSPPPPSPPPPSPPPPSPPPAPKYESPSNNCPPPPSLSTPSGGQKPPNSPYVYINGPPGSVYSVYPYYSGEDRSFSMGMIPFLISSILWVLAF